MVLGGGIGGLAAAIALKKLGLDVQVFEGATSFERVGAGLSLWANATSALTYLGVADKALRQGSEIQASQICRADGRVLASAGVSEFTAQTGLKAFAMHRGDLQTLLLETLGDTSLQMAKTGTVIEQNGAGVRVMFEDGSEQRGDVLIAADGLNSRVRAQLFSANPPSYQGYTVWRGIAHRQLEPTQVDGSFEAWGCGARFGLLPLNTRELYWYAAVNAPEGERLRPEEAKTKLLTLFRDWRQPVEQVIRATEPEAILQTDVYDIAPLKQWTKGRVALLGDAAHAMAPNLGQGACQALEDAVVLAQCFSAEPDALKALKRYETMRLDRAHKMQRLSRQGGKLGQLAQPSLCRLRNTLLPLIPKQVQRRQSEVLYRFEI